MSPNRQRVWTGDYYRHLPLSLLTLSPITTERLSLRALQPSDAGVFHRMTDESAITDAIDFLPTPFTLVDAEKLIRGNGDGRDCFWGVWLRESASLAGTVGTHLRAADELEIGYWFASSVQGRGIGTEAAGAVVHAVTAAFPDRRIVAECRPQNEASWRLLEKIGFRADGADGVRPGRRRLIFVPKI
jgi:RimJ/RimL family protein N-acetyltransferase